jgi:mycobactin phenyloxazoline synthetase
VKAPNVPSDAQIRGEVAALLGVEPSEIAGDTNLVHLGLDSLTTMRLSSRWRRDGLLVDVEALFADPTVDGFARHLRELRTHAR